MSTALIVVISFFQNHDSNPPRTGIVVLSFLLGYGVTRLGLRYELLPAKRDLEALRAKLAESL